MCRRATRSTQSCFTTTPRSSPAGSTCFITASFGHLDSYSTPLATAATVAIVWPAKLPDLSLVAGRSPHLHRMRRHRLEVGSVVGGELLHLLRSCLYGSLG